jgi:hypothetical protein
MITPNRVKEMAEMGYFTEWEARAAGEETTPKLNEDEVVFKDFFVAGLCMPPHSALADILLKF